MGPWLCSHGRSPCHRGRGQAEPCFNGAVALQPRKAHTVVPVHRHWRVASMGPWLCSHGRELVVRDTQPDLYELQWGRGFAATEGPSRWSGRSRDRGFNGAVALQPRKVRHCPTNPSPSPSFNGAVALQPRKATNAAGRRRCSRCFNGAVALQPRKGHRHHRASVGGVASMGPWLCSHGRALGARRPDTDGDASLGPWLCSHGRV